MTPFFLISKLFQQHEFFFGKIYFIKLVQKTSANSQFIWLLAGQSLEKKIKWTVMKILLEIIKQSFVLKSFFISKITKHIYQTKV